MMEGEHTKAFPVITADNQEDERPHDQKTANVVPVFVGLAAGGNNDGANLRGPPAEYGYDQTHPVDGPPTSKATTYAYDQPQPANAYCPPPLAATIQPDHAYRPPPGAATTYAYDQPQPANAYRPPLGAAPPYGYDQPQHVRGYHPTPVVSQPSYINPRQPVMPPGSASGIQDHMGWSIATTLCCCLLLGIIAIIKSNQVREYVMKGDITSAKSASQHVVYLNTAGCITGILILIISLVLRFTTYM